MVAATKVKQNRTFRVADAVFEMPRSKVSVAPQNRRGDNSPRTSSRFVQRKCLRRFGVFANANRTTFRRRESRELVPALSPFAPENVRPANVRTAASLPKAIATTRDRQIARRLLRRRQQSPEFRDR